MQKIRLFLSSPGDVYAERQKVPAVAAQINRMMGDRLKCRLEVIDWKALVAPDMGRPQEVINRQISGYDIFVGIIWKRFGTPTGQVDSGTKEEFNIAYANWQRFNRPRILFYFSQAPYTPKTGNETDQWKKVLECKSQLREKGLIFEYQTLDEFTEILREHLARILQEWFPSQEEKQPVEKFSCYLDYLKKNTMYMYIRGLVSSGSKAHQFGIDQLYIPLKTTNTGLHHEKGKIKTRHTEEMAPCVVSLQEVLQEPKLIIKGDPGAGKTTFLKLITYTLCQKCLGEEPSSGPARIIWPESPLLPIFIRLGELVAHIHKWKEKGPAQFHIQEDSLTWLFNFLEAQSKVYNWQLTGDMFRREMEAGRSLILLDGLDEAPDPKTREKVSALAEQLFKTFPKCRVVLTSRPAALIGSAAVPPGFRVAEIAPLDEQGIKTFLAKWSAALYVDVPEKSSGHRQELWEALQARPEIRRMARTPVMLTALAVVHWNEHRLPEQRAELYESIITWLLRVREKRPGRLNTDQCRKLLQLLALAMFTAPDGRLRQVGLGRAAEILADEFIPDVKDIERAIEKAERFLEDEMVDSGIIVKRGNKLEFWRLSFQEYLAAYEIAGLLDNERLELLFEKDRLYSSEWRELALLLGGVLYRQGKEKINHLIDAIIEWGPKEATHETLPQLVEEGKLLRAIVYDLSSFGFNPANPSYPVIVRLAESGQDELEYKARLLIANGDYSKARYIFEQIIEASPARKEFLESEFGFLYDFTASIEKDKERWKLWKEVTEWRKNIWCILSENNSFPLEKIRGKQEIQIQKGKKVEKPVVDNFNKLKKIDTSLTSFKPWEKGEILEEAVMALFKHFFIIAEETETTILQKLRQQHKGIQFGHDISFECSVRDNEEVKCLIECKNKTRAIVLKDIADKLASTEAFHSNLDHWILISPCANPSNELDILLSLWDEQKKYPFKVHIWCPNRGVRDFFGLCPAIHDLFYETSEDEQHPSQWSERKRGQVFERVKQELTPPTRLSKGWDDYLMAPFRMCLKGENSSDLDKLFQHYVPMRCMDERKNIIERSLEEHVLGWLKDANTPVMFLLGEFGDGKTTFTYILSRKLAVEFNKSPSTGWIPIRFALRDYHNFKNSQEFLQGRLKRFSADLAGWEEVKERYRLLVILDGFDEMTKKLDSNTITKNINDLRDCCNEFKGLKILITSRIHFFENQRDQKRLLQRLPPNRLCYLSPIDRRSNIRHLEEFATAPDTKKKLRSLCQLHDPIGLASKPLFLEMLKVTLHELPEENLDEVTLYETYIKKSINRKKEYLDDDKAMILPGEILSNLSEILERIALKLQASNRNFIFLAEFLNNKDEQKFAEILWKISGSDEVIRETIEDEVTVEEDARARVGVRSLLTRVETENDTYKWPVDFCHRSMREYFVAKGICRALSDDVDKTKDLLTNLPLTHEILYFTAELMRKDGPGKYESNLINIIRGTKGAKQGKSPGGNAATLLFRLKGELPGTDWSGLNLEGADLSGSNLSGKIFSSSSLRYANLDNANLEEADFSHCDLTGVRIEETASVLAIAVHCAGNRIVAAYEDNIIREWNIARQSKRESRIVGKNINGPINRLGITFGSEIYAITNEEIIFYDFHDKGKIVQRARFRIKSEYRQVVVKRDTLILVSDEDHQPNEALLIDLRQQKILKSIKLEKIAVCENFDEKGFLLFDGKATLYIIGIADSYKYKEKTITLRADEVTSLCVICGKKDAQYLLACGQRNGEVLVWQIDLFKGKWQDKLLLKNSAHDGAVTSLAFLDDSGIISGSIDHKIRVVRFGSDTAGIQGIQEGPPLHLIVRCKGMKIDNIEGRKEQETLQRLLDKAEKAIPYEE